MIFQVFLSRLDTIVLLRKWAALAKLSDTELNMAHRLMPRTQNTNTGGPYYKAREAGLLDLYTTIPIYVMIDGDYDGNSLFQVLNTKGVYRSRQMLPYQDLYILSLIATSRTVDLSKKKNQTMIEAVINS